MKRSILAVFLVIMMLVIFTSCDTQTGSGSSLDQPHSQISDPLNTVSGTDKEDGTMLDKLHQIKSDWTEEQVFALLGMPDRYGERSVVAEVFYTVSPATEAVIAF